MKTTKSSTKLPRVTIYCDGSVKKNPGGPGGYAAVLLAGKRSSPKKKVVKGHQLATSNNRMEMHGALVGLHSLRTPCRVTVVTDSEYLFKGMTEWIEGWRKNGWKSKANQRVYNDDLWKALYRATLFHKVTWKWTKGHAGDEYNEEADRLAGEAMREAVAVLEAGCNGE